MYHSLIYPSFGLKAVYRKNWCQSLVNSSWKDSCRVWSSLGEMKMCFLAKPKIFCRLSDLRSPPLSIIVVHKGCLLVAYKFIRWLWSFCSKVFPGYSCTVFYCYTGTLVSESSIHTELMVHAVASARWPNLVFIEVQTSEAPCSAKQELHNTDSWYFNFKAIFVILCDCGHIECDAWRIWKSVLWEQLLFQTVT